MGSMRLKLLLAAASLTALSAFTLAACATAPQPAAPAPRESTAFTLATDQPRTPEQMAMQFDKADLTLRVMPADKAIDAVAARVSGRCAIHRCPDRRQLRLSGSVRIERLVQYRPAPRRGRDGS